jgi:hypothetical protein
MTPMALLLLAALTPGPARAGRIFKDQFVLSKFYKGALHAHSSKSDGDSGPREVYAWYRNAGYNFVALTEHNQLPARPDIVREALTTEVPGQFRIVPAEEVSWLVWNAKNTKKVPVHVTALCARDLIEYRDAQMAKVTALSKIIDKILDQSGAVAIINHPNLDWALDFSDIGPVLKPGVLLELYSSHPDAHNEGGVDPKGDHHEALEHLWERFLARDINLWGVAADDAHEFKNPPHPPKGVPTRPPGEAWVQVAAESLTATGVCEALRAGRFYFTNGVELSLISVDENELEIHINASGPSAESYHTEFLGAGGKLLAERDGVNVSYRLRGNEGYVRARIKSPTGKMAWTQPVRVTQEKK